VDNTYEGPLREPDRNAEFTKDLVIQRDRWLVTVTYTEQWTVPGLAFGEASVKGSRSFTQTLKAELNRTRKGELTSYGRRFYEATTANLDLEDRFQQVTQSKEACKVVAGWHGEKHGPVDGEVRLQFTDSEKHWHLDSEVTENAPAWKTAFQWWGCSPFPDGACEKTDTLSEGVVNLNSEMFTDSGPLVFEEGQDVIRGERSWSELGTEAPFQPEGNLYASANCGDEDLQSPFTTIIYYGLFNADRVQASKTIKWEIRRAGTSR
jgi:NADH:ubiquinone oxidoreductase subunit